MAKGQPLVEIEVTVNGHQHARTVAARQLLIYFLRDELGLRGPKVGCDTGHCGACTVGYNGKTIKSCLMLAPQADGAEIETVETLASDGELSPLQQAFNRHHALQCGYCTSGVLMSAQFLLDRNPAPSDGEIRQGLNGNICRCTGYVNIVEAIRDAAPGAPAEETTR